MLELRPYQLEAIDSLFKCWKASSQAKPVLVVPTGAGKSLINAAIIQRIIERYPACTFLVATHTKEIVRQNSEEFARLCPDVKVGIYSAGLNSKQIRQVTFANIQSIYKADVQFDILIIDEAHLLSRNDDSMYQKLIGQLQKKFSKLKVCGLTATPMRVDQGSLVAEGSTFTEIAYDISVRQLIDQGYLSPIISMAKQAVDLTGVKTSGYDYNQIDLENAFNQDSLISAQVAEVLKAAEGRRHILVFCTGIEHAQKVARAFGPDADYVSGEMLAYERDHAINKFKNGTTRIMCNVGVLTTGFNFKAIDCIVLLRATKSASLYIQMVGRGTRTEQGKLNLLVLDFGGNIERFGPIDAVSIKAGKGNKGEASCAPVKKCPSCACVVPIKIKVCPVCEYPYPDATCKLEIKASSAAILMEPEKFKVDFTTYQSHKKVAKEGEPQKPDSFRIDYSAGSKKISDYLCFAHGGFAATKAAQKWFMLGGRMPAPLTAAEAMRRKVELPQVLELTAVKDASSGGRFYRIQNVVLGELPKIEEYFFADLEAEDAEKARESAALEPGIDDDGDFLPF